MIERSFRKLDSKNKQQSPTFLAQSSSGEKQTEAEKNKAKIVSN